MHHLTKYWKAIGAFAGVWVGLFGEALAREGEITEETLARAAIGALVAGVVTALFPKNTETQEEPPSHRVGNHPYEAGEVWWQTVIIVLMIIFLVLLIIRYLPAVN